MEFELIKEGNVVPFWIEDTAFPGVRKIAEKVCGDVEEVMGQRPRLIAQGKKEDSFVFAGTIGKSQYIDELIQYNTINTHKIIGKRECYLFMTVEHPIQKGKNCLIIIGSDKRGTIYGLFHLSELMGVSPWVHFSSVHPEKRRNLVLTEADTILSKEPSVKYRGFFINDEWPAFGNWTFEQYGGFTAEMYDLIFETLLRLKGNYLWPAMWTSSFSLDGPGDKNAVLADEYGVVMSNSHHEPCLRHSEEWDMVRGEGTIYGNEWNYAKNRDGLLRYWRDGLKRNGKFENIITIGMRGERDSTMLSEDATMKDNIEQLKDIITEQRKLITDIVGEDEPQMIALYKEVETYFYGDEQTQGLKDWEGLNGVTCMLCEDNFGNMRSLPDQTLRNRKGGWGMYYHFDYHGAPISYEWVNSSYLPKVWEQMTEAYESGIRDIWIVNVGDLKFQEYPLSFFMDLAYDYDKWGVNHLNAPKEYLREWIKREFSSEFEKKQEDKLIQIMEGYTKINHNRKPEAMSPEIYHPIQENEAEDLLKQIEELEEILEELRWKVPREQLSAYWQLIYYPARGSLNVQKMNVLVGMNHYYAKMGVVIANSYGKKVEECIQFDHDLTRQLNQLEEGRWNHFGSSEHIGFRNWNDEENTYPVIMNVTPSNKERLYALIKGDGTRYTAGGDWTRKELRMERFQQIDVIQESIILLNGSMGEIFYQIECKDAAVSFSKTSGKVVDKVEIIVSIEKEMIKEETGFDICYKNGRIPVRIVVEEQEKNQHQQKTFIESNGYVSMEAEQYARNLAGKAGRFECMEGYGRTKSGFKVFPIGVEAEWKDAPVLEYQIKTKSEGEFELQVYTAPVNPRRTGGNVTFGLQVNDGEKEIISMIPEHYLAGEPSCEAWRKMVLEQILITKHSIHFNKGLNQIKIAGLSPGFVLEKLILVRNGYQAPETYLGPKETYYCK